MAFQEDGKTRSEFDTGATNGQGLTPDQQEEVDKNTPDEAKGTTSPATSTNKSSGSGK